MQNRIRGTSASVLTIALLAISACTSTEEGPAFYTGDYAHTVITLSPSLLSPGDTGRAHLIAVDENFVPLGELATTWSGDHDGIATVSTDGRILAIAEGQVSLTPATDPSAFGWSLYVSPAAVCGQGLDVDTWSLQGGFTLVDSAASGDSAITVHHTATWSLAAGTPRQVNAGEVVWPVERPGDAAGFTLIRHDTLTVGTSRTTDHGMADLSPAGMFGGEVRLTFSGCKLSVKLWPRTSEVISRLRPGLSDSMLFLASYDNDLSTAHVAVGEIGSGPYALGGMIPFLPPSDADFPFGYGPSGYLAFVPVWKGAPDSLALTMSLTPGYFVPSLTGRK